MTLIIGVVSQKGGVGKSTFARLLAREFAANDLHVFETVIEKGLQTFIEVGSALLEIREPTR